MKNLESVRTGAALGAVALCVAVVLATIAPADASPTRCRETLVKSSQKYLDARTKAVDACRRDVFRGVLGPATDCSVEPETSADVADALEKLTDAVARACGGDDRTCGNGDDETLDSIGWTGACPGLEGQCDMGVSDCDDVSACTACVADAASDSMLSLVWDDAGVGGASDVVKCRQTVAKSSAKLTSTATKSLAKCWRKVSSGKISGFCPDGGTAAKLLKAEVKAVKKICKACGGDDKACEENILSVPGGIAPDDPTPASLGFADTCPFAAVSAGPPLVDCRGSVVTLTDAVECLLCVSGTRVVCTDSIAVPWAVGYPYECTLATPPTTGTTTTTSTTTTSTVTSTTTTTTMAGNGFDDDFDGVALDPSWQIYNPGLVSIDVSGGSLNIVPTLGGGDNIWFNDNEGPLIYKELTGDFDVRATVHARDTDNPSDPPPLSFRLTGILARDPTTAPGGRNSVHVALGAGSGPGTEVSVEEKTTTNSSSVFNLTAVPDPDVELRLVRSGDDLSLYYREIGAMTWNFIVTHTHAEFPATLQVGMMVYSNPTDPRIEGRFDEIVLVP